MFVNSTLLATFQFALPGYYIGSGIKLAAGLSLDDCLARCAVLRRCVAIDYLGDDQSCWMHDHTTSCDALRPTSRNTLHYKRNPCRGPPDPVVDGMLFFPQLQF